MDSTERSKDRELYWNCISIELKSHETLCEILLHALRDFIRILSRFISSETKSNFSFDSRFNGLSPEEYNET